MSDDGILLAIKALGQEKQAHIKQEAQTRAAEAIRDAREKQEATSARHVETRREEAEREALRQEHSARIANGRILDEVRIDFLNRVGDKARQRLVSLRHDDAYGELLFGLCKSSLRQLGDCAVLHVDPRDVDLVEQRIDDLAKICKDVSVRGDIETVGGVIATSCDERITCDDTFEARLKRENAEGSKDIWEVLQG